MSSFWVPALILSIGALMAWYIRLSEEQRMVDQLRLEIWKLDWELDELVDWYSRALSGPSSPEVPNKIALTNQFAKEKEQLLQEKRRLEKKLRELELKG